MQLLRVLAPKLGFLAVVVSIGWALVFAFLFAQAHGDLHCDHHRGVFVVRVPAATVAYTRAQGWHRVLVFGDAAGSPWAYDHSPAVAPVRRGVRHLCDGQRFRLKARG